MKKTAGWLLFFSVLLSGCADSNAVNAAFAQTRVSWFVFDTDSPDGLRALSGLEQAQKVVWLPRTRAVFATDLLPVPGTGLVGAAVTGLGLLVLDDADGTLASVRPGAQLPLTAYRTDKLFVWKGKLFLTLAQEFPSQPPATLAWWAPGQSRLAFYPVPSQIKEPSRQLSRVVPPSGTDILGIVWRQRVPSGWAFESGALDLSNGSEASAAVIPEATVLHDEFNPLRARLAERLGTSVSSRELNTPGARAIYSESGWVAVLRDGSGPVRLYRLPDLGLAGHYTGAIALTRGYVFSWETSFRGYSGAAGLVHVPFSVLGVVQ